MKKEDKKFIEGYLKGIEDSITILNKTRKDMKKIIKLSKKVFFDKEVKT